MILEDLISQLSNIDLNKVLANHKANKAEKQTDSKRTAYFCPLCKDIRTPHFSISNGAHRGGIYNAPYFECRERRISGYGAIELQMVLSGLGNGTRSRLEAIRTLSSVYLDKMPEALQAENTNGVVTMLNPQKEWSIEPMPGFTPEGLAAIGCAMRRMFEKGQAVVVDGQPVFTYSFGAHFNKHFTTTSNWDPAQLQADFKLFQLHGYTTAEFTYNKQKVSLHRKAHALFPIFAFMFEKDGKQWGQIIQPEWNAQVADPMTEANFYYFNGGLNPFKVNTPLLGDQTSQLVFGGTLVKEAVDTTKTEEYLKLEKTIISEDDKGKRTPKDIPLTDKEIRVDNVLLCKDGISAINAYYHLNAVRNDYDYLPDRKDVFFHTVWMLSPVELLSNFMNTQLDKLAYNKYLLFDIDNAGKRASFQIAKRFNNFRIAFLPELMRRLPDMFVGGANVPCRGIQAYLTNYTLSGEESYTYEHDINLLFLNIVNSARSVNPFVYCEKDNKKTGGAVDYHYKLNSSCIYTLMASEGYCREVDETSSDMMGRFIHIDGPFVRELDMKSLIVATAQTLVNFAQFTARPGTQDFEKMCNAVNSSRDINERNLSNLPAMEVDYISSYGPELDYFFYKNGALRITPTNIEFVSYSDIDFNIDVSTVLPFDYINPFKKGEEPFAIIENPEYAKKNELLEEHRKDVKNYTCEQLEIEQQDIQAWAQIYRWTFTFPTEDVSQWCQPMQVIRCFANDEHRKEADLRRFDKTLDETSMSMLHGRMANILYSLGRPIFRFKGCGTNYIPYITENSVSKEGRSEGGSGKSVFVNTFMGCAGHVLKIDSRRIKDGDDIDLKLDNYIHRKHRVIHWEDWAKGLSISQHYNTVTSGFSYRQRHKDLKKIDLKESPGTVLTSNFAQPDDDKSASGRMVITGFSNRFNRGDPKKNLPARQIKEVMPGLMDNVEDMDPILCSQIAYIDALAVQFCMKSGGRVDPPMGDINRRSRVMSLGESFVDWAEKFFAKEKNLRVPLDVQTLLSDYIDMCGASEFKKDKFSPKTLIEKMIDYADPLGYVFPSVCLFSDTDKQNGYMRVKAWCKKIYFADQALWSSYSEPKEVRVLEQSKRAIMFFPRSEVPATPEDVRLLLRKFYAAGIDPDPVLDFDGNAVVLTADDEEAIRAHQSMRQGNRAYVPAPPTEKTQAGPAPAANKEELPF